MASWFSSIVSRPVVSSLSLSFLVAVALRFRALMQGHAGDVGAHHAICADLKPWPRSL